MATAQQQTGNLSGRVVSSKGELLPGVTVTLEGQGSPQARTTGEDGGFRFLGLAPGVYHLRAERENFTTLRINVGGNESGRQPKVVSPGTDPRNTVWQVDGVAITDMVGSGGSSTYYDFDTFEAIEVSVGGADASLATAGATVNLVTKRGTNQWRFSTRHLPRRPRLAGRSLPLAPRARQAGALERVHRAAEYSAGQPPRRGAGLRARGWRTAGQGAPLGLGNTVRIGQDADPDLQARAEQAPWRQPVPDRHGVVRELQARPRAAGRRHRRPRRAQRGDRL